MGLCACVVSLGWCVFVLRVRLLCCFRSWVVVGGGLACSVAGSLPCLASLFLFRLRRASLVLVVGCALLFVVWGGGAWVCVCLFCVCVVSLGWCVFCVACSPVVLLSALSPSPVLCCPRSWVVVGGGLACSVAGSLPCLASLFLFRLRCASRCSQVSWGCLGPPAPSSLSCPR